MQPERHAVAMACPAARFPVGWVAMGVVASAGLALLGTRLGNLPGDGSGRWWFGLPGTGLSTNPLIWVAFYASMGLMVLAWLGVGRQARAGHLPTPAIVGILAVWAVPLLLGPPLFSQDIYSYAAQGTLAHDGLNPYTTGPIALAPGPVLASVAPVWATTPAPYGPLFVAVSGLVMAFLGHSLVVAVTVLRLLELVGIALVAAFLPRLARSVGADPGVALWLGILSPVALFSFVASGHNDALMVGLLVAGVTLAVERRPAAGVVLCALATAVKVPAAAGIAFVAFTWIRSRATWRQRAATTGLCALLAAVTLAVVTWASGLGWGWLGPQVLSVPTDVTLGAAPVNALSVSAYHLLHLAGAPVSRSVVVLTGQVLGGLCAAAVAVLALVRSGRRSLAQALAIALLAVVLVGPVLWPWYLTWGIALLAGTSSQRSRALVVVAALAAFLVQPDGATILGGQAYVGVALVTLAALAWLLRTGRWRSLLTPRSALAVPEPA
ncbi:MAG: polyprenol phosphomannose-dependent alpha 1,6 mannosyltransferase MptB [Acidimicrobiales bacterium]